MRDESRRSSACAALRTRRERADGDRVRDRSRRLIRDRPLVPLEVVQGGLDDIHSRGQRAARWTVQAVAYLLGVCFGVKVRDENAEG